MKHQVLLVFCALSIHMNSSAMLPRRLFSTASGAGHTLANVCKNKRVKRKSMVSHRFSLTSDKTHLAIIPISYLPQDSNGYFLQTPIRSVVDICTLASMMAQRKSPLLLLTHGTSGQVLAKTAQEYVAPRNLLVEKTIQQNPDAYLKFCHLGAAVKRLLEYRNIKPSLIEVIQVEEQSKEGQISFYDEVMINVPESTSIESVADLARKGLSVAYVGHIKL